MSYQIIRNLQTSIEQKDGEIEKLKADYKKLQMELISQQLLTKKHFDKCRELESELKQAKQINEVYQEDMQKDADRIAELEARLNTK